MPLAAGDEARAVALAGLLAVLVGLIVIGAAIARLGFLTDLLSAPVRQGYLNGIALIIVVGQLPRLFGFSASGDSVLERGGAFVTGVRDGETNTVALAIGLACLAIILGLRYRWPRVPGILIAVVGSTIVSAALDLAARSGIAVVGPLPGRSAAAQPAAARPERHPRRRAGGVRDRPGRRDRHEHPVAVVLEPPRRGGRPGPRAARARWREPGHRALHGMPVSSSASRTPVAEAAGAQTQLTSIVGGRSRSAWGWSRRRASSPTCRPPPWPRSSSPPVCRSSTSARWCACGASGRPSSGSRCASFLGVALIGVIEGVFLAVALSLLAFIRRSWWPHDAVLGRADGVKGYHDLTYYPEARQVPGLAAVPVRCAAVLRQCRRLPRSGARAHPGRADRRSAG